MFASRPLDVISFETEPLAADLTFGGEITVDLKVSISTTDTDFVVNFVDEFPVDFSSDPKKIGEKQNSLMASYHMLIRGDVIRGKFRDSFERPKALTPNASTTVSFKLADIAHTFKKGHRMNYGTQAKSVKSLIQSTSCNMFIKNGALQIHSAPVSYGVYKIF